MTLKGSRKANHKYGYRKCSTNKNQNSCVWREENDADVAINISSAMLYAILISMLSILVVFVVYAFPCALNAKEPLLNDVSMNIKIIEDEDVSQKIEEKLEDFKQIDENRFSENKRLRKSYFLDFEELLKEREKAMKMYTFPYNCDGIDKRKGLSLQEFYDVYDGKWPVIVTDVVPTWPAFNWSKKYFLDSFSDDAVFMKGVYGEQTQSLVVPLGVFLSHLEEGRINSWTYLQDELFLLSHPNLRKQLPEVAYMKNNYFNLLPEPVKPWDCMLLWGTAFSRSTLHIDPYNWTGMNAVIYGRKRWKLIPPGQDEHLFVDKPGNCGFPLKCWKYQSKADCFNPKPEHQDSLSKVKMLEVSQEPGEMLFIPTGWFHQAFNEEPTLAISSQIMNVKNYLAVLEEILKGGSLRRSDLPKNLNISPKNLVERVVKLLPDSVLEEGAKVTQVALDQMKEIMNITVEHFKKKN